MAKIIAGVALIAGAIVADAFTGFAATGLTLYAIEAGISMGAGLVMSGIASLLQPNVGTGINSRNPVEPWQVIYGRSRVSGPTICICETGSDDKFLHLIVPIAGHQIESIDAIYFNGYECPLAGDTMNGTGGGGNCINAVYPDPNNPGQTYSFFHNGQARVYADFFLGGPSQPASEYFQINGPPGFWNSNCTLSGLAYVYLRLWWDTKTWPNGLPEIKVDVHGKNDIYDPRTGTRGYSENPALCVADYLCNPLIGLNCDYATEIDEDSLIAAANVCDTAQALAPGGTEPLYTCNGAFKTSQTCGDAIQNMLSCMGGNLSYVAGKWNIYAATWRGTSGIVLDQTDFLGPIEWKPLRQQRDLYNAVRGTFVCPNFVNDIQYGPGYDVFDHPGVNVFAGEWLSTDIPPYLEDVDHGYSSNIWYTEDGNQYFYQDTHFPFVVSCRQAQQLAKIMLERNRQQGTGTLVCGLSAYAIQPLDIIEVNYDRFGWANKQLEVTATRLVLLKDDNGKPTGASFEIDVQETAARVYEWSTAEEMTVTGGNSPQLPNMGAIVPFPTDVTLASGPAEVLVGGDGRKQTRILVTWTPSASGYVQNGGEYIIQLQPNGASTWTDVGKVPGSATSYYIAGQVNDNAYYNVQICAVNSKGATSEFVFVGPILANNTISTFNSSDILDGQGSIVPTADVSFTGVGAYAGSTETVTWSMSATTLTLPSGTVISMPAASVPFTGLTFSTDYYWYPAWELSTSTLAWPGGACDGPSQTALNQQQADGYIPLNLLSFTTGAGTGGTGTGGGTNPCPEANEPIETLERGVIRAIDVALGDHIKGYDLSTGSTVYRQVIHKREEFASLWARVDGHLISPFDEVWSGSTWKQAHAASDEELIVQDGTRLQLTVEAESYDEHNYYVGNLLIHNVRVGGC